MSSREKYVHIRITSADVWRAVQALTDSGIVLQNVNIVDQLTINADVAYRSVESIRKMLQSYGDSVAIRSKPPLEEFLQFLRNRSILLCGTFLLMLISMLISSRVLMVEVTGNVSVPSQRIQQAVNLAGLTFFTSAKEVKMEILKNNLLSQIPELHWVGITVKGCKAAVSVTEKKVSSDDLKKHSGMKNICSERDGVIESITVNRGNAMCTVGQLVRSGEILISGYTDTRDVINTENADGEVFAQTIRKLKCIVPGNLMSKKKASGRIIRISIILGKKRINLIEDSGICDTTCDRICKQTALTLPGGVRLPVSVCVDIFYTMQTDSQRCMADNQAVEVYLKSYLQSQMIAGRIKSSTIQQHRFRDAIIWDGAFYCSEMIGRERFEKNGDLYGENS